MRSWDAERMALLVEALVDRKIGDHVSGVVGRSEESRKALDELQDWLMSNVCSSEECSERDA